MRSIISSIYSNPKNAARAYDLSLPSYENKRLLKKANRAQKGAPGRAIKRDARIESLIAKTIKDLQVLAEREPQARSAVDRLRAVQSLLRRQEALPVRVPMLHERECQKLDGTGSFKPAVNNAAADADPADVQASS